MRRGRHFLVFAALVPAALVLAGCGGSEGPAPRVLPTRIADLHSATMSEVRVEFCDLVPAGAVTGALRGAAIAARHWADGDIPPVDGTRGDVTHEFGCSWSRGRYDARAWVFARPVTAAFARQVIASTRARKGCLTRPSPAFGTPGLLQTCGLPARRTRVRHAGLFGDTWITCEVAGPRRDAGPTAATVRADAWCAAVAGVLNSR